METGRHLVELTSLNECFTCKLCDGYLIDATTIPECMHTFCKSCLVKHLSRSITCPLDSCKKVIHCSHPLKFIQSDRTLQDLVYKLVPGLQQNEIQREGQFYKARNIPNPNQRRPIVPTKGVKDEENGKLNSQVPIRNSALSNPFQTDDVVGVELIPLGGGDDLLKRVGFRYIRCSANATIEKLKKLLALRLYHSIDKMKSIEIFFNEELLGKDHTLKYVIVTRFKSKPGPLKLFYRQSSNDY